MVRITGLSTANPQLSLTQKESLDFILKHFNARPAAKKLYERVLLNEGIEHRYFALDHVEDVLETDLDLLNRRFEEKALSLSAESLLNALKQSQLNPEDLDFLAVSTCTGYLCPGLAAQLIGKCHLRKGIHYVDIVGMGCGSAIPALEQCNNYLEAHPTARVASISTEICSSAIFIADDPELIISNGIFGDGSAAVILQNTHSPALATIRSFHSLTYPEWKETLRFRTEGGRLRNVLGIDVPTQASEAVQSVVKECLTSLDLKKSDVGHWMIHSGGTKVLDEIQKSLELSDEKLAASRKILKNYGNMSSPTVLFVLDESLKSSPPPQPNQMGLLIAFGAGFSVHCCSLQF